MIKKIAIFLSTITLLACTAAFSACGEQEFVFVLSQDKTHYIVQDFNYVGNKDVVIPSSYKGLPVSEIRASGAFGDCSEIVSVTFPRSIGPCAFMFCSSLVSIEIPDCIEYIEFDAFLQSAMRYYEYGNAKYLGNQNNNYLVLVEAVSKDITECTINANTKIILRGAFGECPLQSVIFESLCAWNVTGSTYLGDVNLNLSAEEFSDPSDAATLVNYYFQCFWKRI